MKDKAKKSDAMQLDFSSIELTIQNIVDRSGKLVDMLYQRGCELAETETALRKATADISLQARNSGVKVTEGHISNIVDSDDDIIALRKKVGMQNMAVTCLRQELENIHDVRKMFTAWMETQKLAGLV